MFDLIPICKTRDIPSGRGGVTSIPAWHGLNSLIHWRELVILRGFDPLLLFFMNEIKIVSYSFSSPVIEYNSNEKLLKA